MLWQPSLPPKYTLMSDEDLAEAIRARRRELGADLVILGHHYQQDDVIQHADYTGDSFKLAQLAARKVREAGAKYVVFCGVHFMAESADILTPDDVAVILPDLSAGCSMADMADYDQTVQAWEDIHEALEMSTEHGRGPQSHSKATGVPLPARANAPRDFSHGLEGHAPAPAQVRIIPITYMNSSAAIKAFVGQHGGAVCTSSNAPRVIEWALEGGGEPLRPGEEVKILFIPDQHLGRNTAHALGFITEVDAGAWASSPCERSMSSFARAGSPCSPPRAQTAVWDPKEEFGGLTPQQIRDAKILLWKGHCSVHKLYRPEHVHQIRAKHPNVTVLVHPEVCQEVVDLADLSGSTEFIIRTIESAEPGSVWAVATEVHLVNRLANAAKQRGVYVEMLSGCQCLCTTMYRIDQPHLLWVLDNLAEGKVVNQIRVHPEARKWALTALNRMLSLAGEGSVKAAVAAV